MKKITNKKIVIKPVSNIEADKISNYAKAPHFVEKDEKAKAFLKNHPVPDSFFR